MVVAISLSSVFIVANNKQHLKWSTLLGLYRPDLAARQTAHEIPSKEFAGVPSINCNSFRSFCIHGILVRIC